MRAARYGSLNWHKQSHTAARKRLAQLIGRIENSDTNAGPELVDYLSRWLQEHTRLSDRMMGAFLRNHRRSVGKLTFRAGTKPIDACAWVDVNGDKFDPLG